MPTRSISPKERVRRAVDAMPDESSLEDVIARLVVLHKLERGLAEVDAEFEHRRAQHNA